MTIDQKQLGVTEEGLTTLIEQTPFKTSLLFSEKFSGSTLNSIGLNGLKTGYQLCVGVPTGDPNKIARLATTQQEKQVAEICKKLRAGSNVGAGESSGSDYGDGQKNEDVEKKAEEDTDKAGEEYQHANFPGDPASELGFILRCTLFYSMVPTLTKS